ncbi:MAG: LacI family DNA-binding transcriptional regulator [Dermatophilaceae bacterium]
MAVRLKDVADLAGVSVKTVSNVVNGYAFVGAENRRRVEAALRETGYRPNVAARNLRRGRTGFIALVVPDLGIPYFGELSALVINAASARGWNVLIEQTVGDRDRERASLEGLGPHLVDGAIISPEALEAADFASVSTAFPMVLLGEHAVEVPIARVAIDNVAAGRAATEHLLGIGRRRIGVIGDHARRGTAALRLHGYAKALAQAGIEVERALVAPVESYHRRDGAMAMARLLDLDPPPDAVFCFNDLLAVGALRECRARGIRVPADVAVIGFDGSDESGYTSPLLSTVAPDKTAIAEAAVELVAAAGPSSIISSAADQGEPRAVLAPFSLEVRESTAG